MLYIHGTVNLENIADKPFYMICILWYNAKLALPGIYRDRVSTVTITVFDEGG
jgi:hypothetical protein